MLIDIKNESMFTEYHQGIGVSTLHLRLNKHTLSDQNTHDIAGEWQSRTTYAVQSSAKRRPACP
jgi:hypothetical protein